MKFPVWSTVVEAFDYCWRERAAMVRFGWIPVVVVMIVTIILEALGMGKTATADMNDPRAQATMFLVGIIQAIVFLSVSVTWYQKVVLGDEAAAQRPVFSLGRLEMRMFGWQLVVIAGLLVAGVIGAFAIIFLYGLLAASGQDIAAVAVAIVLGAALLLVLGFAAMRFAMVLVLVALDKPVHVRDAWQLTNGVGWRLVGAVALTTIGGAILGVVCHLAVLVIAMIASIGLGTSADQVTPYIDAVVTSVTGLLIFLVGATVFGFVYRMVTTHAETLQVAETPSA